MESPSKLMALHVRFALALSLGRLLADCRRCLTSCWDAPFSLHCCSRPGEEAALRADGRRVVHGEPLTQGARGGGCSCWPALVKCVDASVRLCVAQATLRFTARAGRFGQETNGRLVGRIRAAVARRPRELLREPARAPGCSCKCPGR